MSCNKSAKKRVLMPKSKNDKGTITSRKGIANVFGEFHSKLYAGDETEEELQNTLNHEPRAVDEDKHNEEGNNEEKPMITDEEIQAAINKLKAKPATTMEPEPKTSRLVTMR